MLRRWWWLILGCTLLAGVTAYLVIKSMDPMYEATATLLVTPGQDSGSNEFNTLVAGERLALTYIEMLKSRTILDPVISQLGLNYSSDELVKKINAGTVKDTQLIRLTVENTSPEQAALLANTIAKMFTTYIQKLQADRYASSLDNLQQEINALDVIIEGTQSQIDASNAKKIKDEARLENLEKLLGEQRNDFRSLERDYEDLKLTISQLTDIVKIVEPAQATGETAPYPFHATAILLAGRSPTSAGSVEANEQLIETYSKMLVGRPVLEAAIARLGLDEDPESLLGKISVEAVKDTQLIRLSVADNDTSRAALMANTISEIFIGDVKTMLTEPYTDRLTSLQEQLDDLSTQTEEIQAEIASLITGNGQTEAEMVRLETLLADQRSEYQRLEQDYRNQTLEAADAAQVVSITDPALIPNKVADSNGPLYIAIASIVGALLGTGFAFLLEYLNDTIQTTTDINRQLGLVTLGTIGQIQKKDRAPLVIYQPLAPNAESFRRLAANLRFIATEHPLRSLLVTSANPQEGKSTISGNLAAALALTEPHVVVVDADLRKPHLHQIFSLEQNNGLTDALIHRTLNGRLKQAEPANLKVFTSGSTTPNPAEVVGSTQMFDLLEDLKQQFGLVLIDCPPVLPVADATLLAPHVDGVLIVVRANSTRSRAVVEAVDSLRKVGAHILGVVLNATPEIKKGYYDYYTNPEKDKADSETTKSVKDILINVQDKIGRKI